MYDMICMMYEYSIVFLDHLSSFKALLYAWSLFGAPVMISWQVLRVFQAIPTAIFPHFTKVPMEWCYIQISNWS